LALFRFPVGGIFCCGNLPQPVLTEMSQIIANFEGLKMRYIVRELCAILHRVKNEMSGKYRDFCIICSFFCALPV